MTDFHQIRQNLLAQRWDEEKKKQHLRSEKLEVERARLVKHLNQLASQSCIYMWSIDVQLIRELQEAGFSVIREDEPAGYVWRISL